MATRGATARITMEETSMVSRPPLRVCRPLVAAAATAILSATLAGATPFFFCESLPDPPGQERAQGYGSQTLGGAGKPVIHVGPVPVGCDPPPPPTQAH